MNKPCPLDEDRIITVGLMAKHKYCVSGQKYWFESQKFDWEDYVANGKRAGELWATGDGLIVLLFKRISKSEGLHNGK